jgi:3-hydroxy-9,10-secoandrosta-1,3,5(10)-triene-9,17-dione monooxygenase
MLAADGADAAGPSIEELRARAAALIPQLRERQARTEALRAIPDETIAEFREAGLFSLFRPARYRGIELPFRAFVEFGALIGRGCGSSSWVLNNLLSHNWMLGFWPVEAQDEIWRDDPDTLVGSAFIFPCGSARRVDGGYRVSGRWPFSSGIDPSRWTMLAAILRDAQGNPAEHRFFVVPQSDYKVIDTWQVMGLIGTGSKDVVVEDVFVPEHRTLNAEAGKGGPGPGGTQNTSPLFRLPWFGLFSFVNAGTVLGIAQGAVEQFIEATRKRAATYTGKGLAELATMQVRIAEAAALVDTAEAMMLKDCDECWDIVAAGDQPTLEAKVRWRRDGAYAAGMCVRAVDLVFTGAGGGAIHEENPLQRSFRDVHAAYGHIGLNWDFNGAMFGRVTLGLPPDAPLL